MQKIVNGYSFIVEKINKAITYVLTVLLMVMTVLIFWQVFARFVMGSPLSFSEEIARFCMLWLTMLGSAYAFRKGSLIAVDVLLELGGPIIRKVLKIAIPIISIVFAYILVIHGFELVDRVASQIAPSTRISMKWPVLSVPIGGILIFVNSIDLLFDELFRKEND